MINPYTGSRKWVFLTVFAMLALVATLGAKAIETQAKQAYLIDVATGSVLIEKNADQPVPPASMSTEPLGETT